MGLLLNILLALFLLPQAHTLQVSKTTLPPNVQHVTILDNNFSIQNTTMSSVGWCNIHLIDNTYSYIDVTTSGTFAITLLLQPYECSIHGQSFGPNTPTRIIIDEHTSVRATWTGNIIVIDDLETR
jgi:hypothetical protein